MAEVALSVKYKKKNAEGTYSGGPMYYIKRIRGKFGKILAFVYSIALLTYVITDSCFAQMNTLVTTVNEIFGIPTIIVGAIAIFIAMILLNVGLNKTSKVLKRIIPAMTMIYLFFGILIIVINIRQIPQSLFSIVKYAFQPVPVIGGFAGASVMLAISKGAARGIFANEAGLGTSATVYATAKDGKPIYQGMWGILEVGLVSFGTCTMTAWIIMTTGVLQTGDTGAILVLNAFQNNFGILRKSHIGYYNCIVCIYIISWLFC